MKKEDWIELLIYVAIGVWAAGVTGRFLYQSRREFRQAQAGSAFGMALQEELQKWKDIDVYIKLSGNYSLPDDSIEQEKALVKVSVESDCDKREYLIPYVKHNRNVERTFKARAIHSYLSQIYPLNADSLNLFWKHRLAVMELPGTTIVRISVTDWEGHESCTYSADSLYLSKADSLSTCYIGCRCEVGVTGYLYYPWWMTLSWKDWAVLAVVIAVCLSLFGGRKVYRCFLVKEKHIVVERCKNQPHIYQLEENVYFDADSRSLKRGDDVMKLSPLVAKLLQGFLEAEDYRMSNDEILNLLWPDGSGTSDRLHQTMKRLRLCLSRISVCTIENENFAYRLKIPHSIEKNPV